MPVTKDHFSAIADQVSPGSVVLRQWPLKGGVSANMYAIELEQRSGENRCVVIRQHRAATWKSLDDNVTANEFDLLRVLYDQGLKVPEPLHLDCSGSILASPYLVTEYINGTTSVPPEALDNHLQQMADFLRRLHGLDPGLMPLPNLPTIEDPAKGALQYLPKISEDRSLLDVISSMRAKAKTRRLLHGDFWPGNMMWNDGRLVAVLDWEDATFGDPMSDVACCRVELLCQYGRSAMDTFTDYYLGDNIFDVSDLRLWEIYVSASALVSMAGWGLSADDEKYRRQMTKVFLNEAAAKL